MSSKDGSKFWWLPWFPAQSEHILPISKHSVILILLFFSKDEDVCKYDVIKTESLVTACEESCNNKNGNNTLCALLIQTHELLTAKFGENGAGKPPVLQSPILLDAAKKVENASKMLEENPKVPVQFQPIPKEGIVFYLILGLCP